MNNSLVMFSTNNSLCKVDFSSTGLSSSFFVLFFFDNSYSSSLLDSSCENKKSTYMPLASDDLQIRDVGERSYISQRSAAAILLVGR